MADIRDRITDLRRVRAGDLLPNPKNWRRHPPAQQKHLQAVLAEVGWADALIGRQTDQGIELLDGHLRAGLDPEAIVPVLIVDLDDAEADIVLATLDPLAAMAEPDQEKLRSLLENINAESIAVGDLLLRIGNDQGALSPDFDPVEDALTRLDQRNPIKCPECGNEFVPN